MAKRVDKNAQRIRRIFDLADCEQRAQWEYINQKGVDFSNDNQITDEERIALEEQGMPTFTINRILPVVEMLNFYATANKPRWQAVGAEGSDVDVAAVFSDMADYIWDLSNGSSLYANCINDCITKSLGFLMVSVDPDADNGMGDVVLKNVEPFDVFVDPKSRDLLFRDAAFIMIRKILPKEHLISIYPDHKTKIKNASGFGQDENNYSEKSMSNYRKDFGYKEIDDAVTLDGENDELVEFYEMYEKIKVSYVNVFYRKEFSPEQLQQIQQQVQVRIQEMQAEMEVELMEQQKAMTAAVESGEMLPERMQLEMEKTQKMQEQQLQVASQQMLAEAQQQAEVIENLVISEKEFKLLEDDPNFKESVVDVVQFYGTRIKQSIIVGDKTITTNILPEGIDEYPIIPFHFKWTGTPYPMSAVSPLIGKQREINKAHQILVHNASLGSSLRWMHEEGSIDTDHWERYSSAPGALLPIRPGAQPPTPVQPAPLNSAFFQIVQEAKGDMEYLAGIYSSMMGDSGGASETYRGMLALDEYGTRRIKQWMQNSLDVSLKQLGVMVKQFTQAVYTAHKVFRIVQPSAIQEQREIEINIPLYNDLGESVGKIKDYNSAKFDVRIIAGSTLPINRWAYLAELKELMQMGVVDDIAVLAETDIRNKENIAKRKSMYAQMQGQLGQQEEQIKDLSGTIETLERQLVQAGIKGKVMQAEMEISKKKEEVKTGLQKEYLDTEAKQKNLQSALANKVEATKAKIDANADKIINNLQNNVKND
tara:strand:- start:5250 stop:7544 length:2295 start_codon:yes stop_codon:yes gene_type:complete